MSIDPISLPKYQCGECFVQLTTWHGVISHHCLEGCSHLTVDKKTGRVGKEIGASTECENPKLSANVETISQEHPEGSITTWNDAAIKVFIQLCKDHRAELENKNVLKRSVWNTICEEMKAEGYTAFSQEQINSKWKGLKRSYKSTREYNEKRGNAASNRKQWKYYELMDEVIGESYNAAKSIEMNIGDELSLDCESSQSSGESRTRSPSPVREVCTRRSCRKRRLDIDELLLKALTDRRIQHEEDMAEKRRFNDLLEQLVQKL